jgi:hypothetical protein
MTIQALEENCASIRASEGLRARRSRLSVKGMGWIGARDGRVATTLYLNPRYIALIVWSD